MRIVNNMNEGVIVISLEEGEAIIVGTKKRGMVDHMGALQGPAEMRIVSTLEAKT